MAASERESFVYNMSFNIRNSLFGSDFNLGFPSTDSHPNGKCCERFFCGVTGGIVPTFSTSTALAVIHFLPGCIINFIAVCLFKLIKIAFDNDLLASDDSFFQRALSMSLCGGSGAALSAFLGWGALFSLQQNTQQRPQTNSSLAIVSLLIATTLTAGAIVNFYLMKTYLPKKLEMDMGHALLVAAVDLALFASIIGLIIKPQRYMNWVVQLNNRITDKVNYFADSSDSIGNCMHWFDNCFSFVTRQQSAERTRINTNLLTADELGAMQPGLEYPDSIAGNSSTNTSDAGDSEPEQEAVEKGNSTYNPPEEVASNPMINPVSSGGSST